MGCVLKLLLKISIKSKINKENKADTQVSFFISILLSEYVIVQKKKIFVFSIEFLGLCVILNRSVSGYECYDTKHIE